MDQEDKPTIDNMPDEVLVEVFSFLSPKLLKISALVCNRWNDLIGRSPELMKNFRLSVFPGLSQYRDVATSIATLTRRFQNLKIDSLDGAVPEILQKLNNIRTLEIARSSIQRQQLVDALASMKHLNTLKAENLEIIDKSDSAIEPVKLDKLKNLSLKNCSEDILSLFSTTMLETIEISSLKSPKWTVSACELVTELLMNQPALQSLSLHQVDITNILEKDFIRKFPFRLQSFKLSSSRNLSTEASDEAFRRFLKLHKDTLKILVLQDFPFQEESVLELNNLTNLESLDLPFNIILEYSKGLQPFAKVKSYSTQCFTISPANIEAFERLFPAMENLQVKLTRDNVTGFPGLLNYNTEQFPGLKELAFPIYCDGLSPNLKFKNLKSVKIGAVLSPSNFPAFIERHADTLESLEIDSIGDDTSSVNDTIDSIQSCSKLKRISLFYPNPIIIFKDRISRNHAWTLETRIFLWHAQSSFYQVPVAFKFPDDEALFQDKCTTWDEEVIRELKGFDFEDCIENELANKFK